MQLFHRGWDQHTATCPAIMQEASAQATDQAGRGAGATTCKQRGMLDDTLDRLGRRIRPDGLLARKAHLTADDYGRDHHRTLFHASGWPAAAIKPGIELRRKTDDYSYNIVENPVHISDMNATILHTLGINHNRLTFKFPRTSAASYRRRALRRGQGHLGLTHGRAASESRSRAEPSNVPSTTRC